MKYKLANDPIALQVNVPYTFEHSHAGGLVNFRDALKFSLLFWAITASSFFHRKFWKFDGNFKDGNLHGISVDLPNAYKS